MVVYMAAPRGMGRCEWEGLCAVVNGRRVASGVEWEEAVVGCEREGSGEMHIYIYIYIYTHTFIYV